MADDDHSQQPRCRRRRRDNRDGNDRGGSCSDTTIAAPHGSDGYTPWPLYLNPRADTIQMWLGSVGEGGGGRCPAASPIGYAGRCSPLRSPSVAGHPDFCAAPGACTSGGVATMDDP
jgi:hypothetical protein